MTLFHFICTCRFHIMRCAYRTFRPTVDQMNFHLKLSFVYMTSHKLLKDTWAIISHSQQQGHNNYTTFPQIRSQVSVFFRQRTQLETPEQAPVYLIKYVSSTPPPSPLKHQPTQTIQQHKQLQKRPSPQYKYSVVAPSPLPASASFLFPKPPQPLFFI